MLQKSNKLWCGGKECRFSPCEMMPFRHQGIL